MRSGHLDAAQQSARSAFDFRVDSTIVWCFRRQCVGVCTTTDGETFGFVGKHGAVLRAVGDVDGHHTAGCRFEVVFGPAGQRDLFADMLEQFVFADFQFDEMVEMHCVEQAFDHREAVDVHGSEGRVDGGPCRSDERVRCDAGRHQVAWQRAAGGRFMVVAGMRLAERIGGFVSHLFNNRHGGELVASNGGVTNASSICKHTVHVFR